nr:stage II sporulation protein D [Bacilli bacterium]
MKKLLFISVVIVLMIYVVNILFEEQILDKYKFNFNENTYVRVKRESLGIIDKVPFEEYIIGVVAGEMPASFDIEALKAQAVAARSYVLTKMKQNFKNDYDVVDTISNQVYLDDNKLRSNWGNNYDVNINKVKEAVISTRGEYLTYNGEVVNAFFFSTSVGKTENCVDVFGGNLPYLVSVDSSWDEDVSPVFAVEKEYTLDDFYAGLDLPYAEDIKMEIIDTTSTGRIKKIKINDKEYTGSEVASKLSLRSAFFKIEQDGNKVYINTKGYGHGVGMSQYGALAMAKRGYNYKEILKHYYTNVEISNL